MKNFFNMFKDNNKDTRGSFIFKFGFIQPKKLKAD